MNQTKLNRINELARKAKTTGLTEEEKKEQHALRQEYIMEFRNSMISTLDNTIFVDQEGNEIKLQRKNTKDKH